MLNSLSVKAITVRWPSIRRPCLAGFWLSAVVAVVSIFVRNSYTSQALLLPVSQGPSGGLAAAAAIVGLNLPVGGGTDDTVYPNIIYSRSVVEPLLTTTYVFHEPNWRFGQPELKRQTLLEYMNKKNLDKGFMAIKDVLDCQRDIKSGITKIEVETCSPELSQAVARKAVDLLQDFQLNQTQTKGGQRAVFSEERLLVSQKAALESERALIAFEQRNQNATQSSDPGIRLMDARLQADLTSWRQVVSNLFTAREQALLDKANEIPVLNILDHGNLPIEKSGPARLLITIIAFVFGFLMIAMWDHWEWIKARMAEK